MIDALIKTKKAMNRPRDIEIIRQLEAIKARKLNLVSVVLNRLGKPQDERMDNATDLRARLDCAVFALEYSNDSLPDDLVNRVLTQPALA